MSNYIVTVIKTGNSYALRVPKQYVEDAKLLLGQKTTIDLPRQSQSTQQNKAELQEILRKLAELKPYKNIADPVAWQREIRADRPLPGRP